MHRRRAINIVEILDANKSRAAYGTIVSHDGLIVTWPVASRNPDCRMPDNNLTTAAVIGKDEEADVALLKVSLPTQPGPLVEQSRLQTRHVS